MGTYYRGQLSITDEVYNRIMSQIADGIWREGDKLPSENMLCKKFSVSRVSVRAAMQRLKAHGYISTRHSVGSFVASPRENDALAKSASDITGRDYLELFEFRQAMELRAIDLYVIRASDSEKEDLQKCADGMSANTNELREFTKWDMNFHETIMRGAHNKYLYHAFMAHKDAFFHYLEEINRLGDINLDDLASNHRWMCACLLKRQPSAVKRRLLNDNAHFYDTVFKHII